MGRLKDGVTVDQANAEFVGLARRLAQENPKTNAPCLGQRPAASEHFHWTATAANRLDDARCGRSRLADCMRECDEHAIWPVALRAKELAIRGALGATRWRLVRQMLTETLLVAMFGAVAGVILAHWAIDLLIRTTNALPFPLPYWVAV